MKISVDAILTACRESLVAKTKRYAWQCVKAPVLLAPRSSFILHIIQTLILKASISTISYRYIVLTIIRISPAIDRISIPCYDT